MMQHDITVYCAFPAVLETSILGIFAAGDVRTGSAKQFTSAAGDGGAAALMIRDYLKSV
jgi:thioredoxin reductase (NADPH)